MISPLPDEPGQGRPDVYQGYQALLMPRGRLGVSVMATENVSIWFHATNALKTNFRDRCQPTAGNVTTELAVLTIRNQRRWLELVVVYPVQRLWLRCRRLVTTPYAVLGKSGIVSNGRHS